MNRQIKLNRNLESMKDIMQKIDNHAIIADTHIQLQEEYITKLKNINSEDLNVIVEKINKHERLAAEHTNKAEEFSKCLNEELRNTRAEIILHKLLNDNYNSSLFGRIKRKLKRQ